MMVQLLQSDVVIFQNTSPDSDRLRTQYLKGNITASMANA